MKSLGDSSLNNVKKFLILMLVLSPSIALADDDPTVQPIKDDTIITLAKTEQLDIATMLAVVMPEPTKKEPPKSVEPKAPEPVTHEVQDGDTLTSIGEAHQLPWTRVYDANTEVEDPNVIKPGEKLRIPRADETIVARPIPENAPPVQTVQETVVKTAYKVPVHYEYSAPELTGSYGSAIGGGNCVNTAKRYGKSQPGNPISWAPTTQTPFIGAAALFYFNHVAIVTGIHSDGSVEVTHENCPGCPTRYSRGSIRGFF